MSTPPSTRTAPKPRRSESVAPPRRLREPVRRPTPPKPPPLRKPSRLALGVSAAILLGVSGVAGLRLAPLLRDPAALRWEMVNVGVPASMRGDRPGAPPRPVTPPAAPLTDAELESARLEAEAMEPPPPLPPPEPPPQALAALAVEPPPPAAAPVEPPPAPKPPPMAAAAPGVRVQIAAADSEASAQRAWSELARAFPGETRAHGMQTEAVTVNGHDYRRVLVDGFLGVDDAKAFCARLTAAGRGCILRKPG